MYSLKERGFTLVELIVVIVLLAVLAVVAIPKYVDLKTDARIATLEGMKGTIESGTTMINMKAIIEDIIKGTDTLTTGGVDILLESGFPTGDWVLSMRYIPGLDDVAKISGGNNVICDIEWCGKGNQTSISSGITTSGDVVIGKVFPEGYSFNDQCGVYLINNLDGNKPLIAIESDDCE